MRGSSSDSDPGDGQSRYGDAQARSPRSTRSARRALEPGLFGQTKTPDRRSHATEVPKAQISSPAASTPPSADRLTATT
ncbi:MAG: hypothetical protein AVDCRST_MAG20-2255 [uncultured Acidimicrobiales bacterium]|uniref:Uncharacterized protein n=1 Tax=uncultured Acidimicrobiales bacterium TaxID=310071 RepID=A0A6J4IJK7_9ACTN|nr:MAG: hypothetical protein AVDCRST_MAG20-2255 [uncultured Acidimicrobiales bacterium]